MDGKCSVLSEGVRKRLQYIEPAREDVVMPFNTLIYETPVREHCDVKRTSSLILSAWENLELSTIRRLRKGFFVAFLSVARLKRSIAISEYLLQRGSAKHNALLKLLSPEIRNDESLITEFIPDETGRGTPVSFELGTRDLNRVLERKEGGWQDLHGDFAFASSGSHSALVWRPIVFPEAVCGPRKRRGSAFIRSDRLRRVDVFLRLCSERNSSGKTCSRLA